MKIKSAYLVIAKGKGGKGLYALEHYRRDRDGGDEMLAIDIPNSLNLSENDLSGLSVSAAVAGRTVGYTQRISEHSTVDLSTVRAYRIDARATEVRSTLIVPNPRVSDIRIEKVFVELGFAFSVMYVRTNTRNTKHVEKLVGRLSPALLVPQHVQGWSYETRLMFPVEQHPQVLDLVRELRAKIKEKK